MISLNLQHIIQKIFPLTLSGFFGNNVSTNYCDQTKFNMLFETITAGEYFSKFYIKAEFVFTLIMKSYSLHVKDLKLSLKGLIEFDASKCAF